MQIILKCQYYSHNLIQNDLVIAQKWLLNNFHLTDMTVVFN